MDDAPSYNDSRMNFYYEPTGNIMTIHGGMGTVGIGTIWPAEPLHINGKIPYIRWSDTDGGNYWRVGLEGDTGFRIKEVN